MQEPLAELVNRLWREGRGLVGRQTPVATSGETVRADDLWDVQCGHCKTMHPLRQRTGDALACMDRLNNTLRPCPSCGARGRWVMIRTEGGQK